MNKKLLVGFEIFISSIQDFNTDGIINFELLQSLREISMKSYEVKHIKYKERDKIQIYCTTEIQEVPLLSRGKDIATKALIDEAKIKYSALFENIDSRFTWVTINPMYLTFSEGHVCIYRQYIWGTKKVDKLSNTILWYKYCGMFQEEIDMCMEDIYYRQKKNKKAK